MSQPNKGRHRGDHEHGGAQGRSSGEQEGSRSDSVDWQPEPAGEAEGNGVESDAAPSGVKPSTAPSGIGSTPHK